MKINNLNNSISFKRVINVETPMSIDSKKGEIDKRTIELAKVLNNRHSSLYTQEEAESIKTFFKTILGDYDGRTNIEIRKPNAGKNVILLSGKDAKVIKKMEQEAALKKKSIQKSNSLSNRRKKEEQALLTENINLEIYRRLENGDKGKQKTYIDLESRGTKSNKINYFKYWSINNFFTSIKDGAVQKQTKPSLLPTEENKAQNVICEERVFRLN